MILNKAMKLKRLWLNWESKAKFILSNVINYFYNHSDELPQLYKNIINEEGLKRGVADYIAGMTDDYCLSVFNKIYVPKFVIY